MGSQKAKKKNRKKKALLRFKSSLTEKGFLGNTPVTLSPPGQVRMSDVLEEFIEPFREPTHDAGDLKLLLSLALIAWNAALLPVTERNQMIDGIIGKTLPPDVKAEAVGMIRKLIERKEKDFAHYPRRIVDYQLTTTKDGWHLSVASLP